MPLSFRLLLFCPFCSIHEFRDTPFLIILLARIPPIPVVQPGQTLQTTLSTNILANWHYKQRGKRCFRLRVLECPDH